MTTQSLTRPLIAIVGSVDPQRAQDLGLHHIDQAADACAALGCELAAQGLNIVVYSSAAGFVEGEVVRGYAAHSEVVPQSIQVRAPQDKETHFPAAQHQPALFDHRPDASEDWEVSYYRSLVETDGVLLVGGGRSTYVTGLIALTFGIPIVPVACFGGLAVRVWKALDRVGNDAKPDEIALMGRRDWSDDMAAPLVQALIAQCKRRDEKREAERRGARKERRRASVSLLVAAVCVISAFGAIPLSYSFAPGTVTSIALLIAAPLTAFIAGAIVRHSFDRGHEWLRTAILGMAVGGAAGLLFIAAQLLTSPDVLSTADARRLLWFVVPVGFVAGLTFDAVYRKLRSQDVTRSDVLSEL